MPKATRLALRFLATLAASTALIAASAGAMAQTVQLTAQRGDTLAELLDEAGVPRGEAQEALAALARAFPPRGLAVGQEVELEMDRRRGLLGLEIETPPGRILSLRRTAEGWRVTEQLVPRHRHLTRVEMPVQGGVQPTLVRAGVPAPLVHGLVRALAHEVDFQRDLQPGDRIAVAWERLRSPGGELLGHGRALHVQLTLSGRVLDLWRHAGSDGETAWYHADGRPLAGGFLRTPLDGARITSGFGQRRHPVLGFSRQHAGVDFAAPPGTPVYAAAEGVVAAAAFEGGYGRTIRLRHPNGAETVYAHLSRFAPGLRPGQRVRQGQTIGHVGSTGLSTGPHLHYEVRMAGVALDPARAPLPAAAPLRGAELAEFQARRRQLSRQIALLAAGMTEVALAP